MVTLVGMKAIVSGKGQVTIPKAVRAKLGIRPGTVIEFEADRGRLVGRMADTTDAIDELFGSLTLADPVDEYIERVRGR
jgi:antitoxin PrlF